MFASQCCQRDTYLTGLCFRVSGIIEAEEGDKQVVAIGFLPLFHVFGLILMFSILLKGFKLVTLAGFNPDCFLENIQKHKVCLYVICTSYLYRYHQGTIV